MRAVIKRVLTVLCILLASASADALAQQGILNAIPEDAVGFAVVHKLTDASHRFAEVAKIVQAPAPELLSLAKQASGLNKGLDEQGDLIVVLTSVDPNPKGVMLIPVSNFAEFFGALGAKEPPTDIVEVNFARGPKLVGRKGNFAVVALTRDRDTLEKFVASNTSLAADASLAEWLEANKASVVVTSRGVKQLVPKLMDGIRTMQTTFRAMPGDQGKVAADGFNLYLQILAAAESEVVQFAIGLRIDSNQTIDVAKRVQFVPEGSWAKLVADVKPATEDLLAGLPAEPFVMAGAGIVPPGMMEQMMNFSVQIMQSQPKYKLTPEQAQKYAALSVQAMSGMRSVKMLMGVSEPGAGLYGNTIVVATVDDAQAFVAGYEKALAEMRAFVEEVKSPMIQVATVEHVKVGALDVFEVTMDMSQMSQIAAPGGPNPEKMMEAMMGPGGKMKIYLAAADEHTIVMSYTSLERLQAAIDFYKSGQPGLSAEAGVSQVAAALPSGSQTIGFVKIDGMINVVRQVIAISPGARAPAIPDLPASPPLGFAAMVSPTGIEGHLVVSADTLWAIGETVAKARGAAAGGGGAPQQK